MIVELRWIRNHPPANDEFEHVEMPETPAVGDMVTTDDRSGMVANRMWLLPAKRTAETPIMQATVKPV